MPPPMKPLMTATDLSLVFSGNLKQLVADQPSIAAVCRELDINRTQFNRYLSGEAHPRPEVLARICAHFDRDARILLEPLADIDGREAPPFPHELNMPLFTTQSAGFDHNRMPDGLYRVVMPWFNEPDVVFSDVIRLFTSPAGIKLLNWSVPVIAAKPTGKPYGWRDRKQTALCLQHADGVSMHMVSAYSRLFLLYFVSPGYQGLSNVHVGYAAMTLGRTAYQAPVQPLIIESLPSGIAAALHHRRNGNLITPDALTDLQRHYFETWQPGWTGP